MIFDFRNTWILGLFVLIIIGFSACNKKSEKQDNSNTEKLQEHDSKEISTAPEYSGEPVDIDSVEIRTFYITEKDSAALYTKPDIHSTVYKTLPFGKSLKVIGGNGKWLTVLYYHEKGAYKKNGREYFTNDFEWQKFYIEKDKTDSCLVEHLIDLDLYSCVYRTREYYDDTADYAYISRKYLKISNITKQVFNTNKSNAIDLIINDTLVPSRSGNKTIIECDNGTKTLTDRPNDGDMVKVYSYTGFCPKINSYVFHIQRWESHDFLIVNKSDRNIPNIEVENYPFITPCGKYVMVLNSGPYRTTDLTLLENKDNNLVLLISVCFNNWSLYHYIDPYMDKKGDFYLAFGFPVMAHKASENVEDDYQFLKISIRQ